MRVQPVVVLRLAYPVGGRPRRRPIGHEAGAGDVEHAGRVHSPRPAQRVGVGEPDVTPAVIGEVEVVAPERALDVPGDADQRGPIDVPADALVKPGMDQRSVRQSPRAHVPWMVARPGPGQRRGRGHVTRRRVAPRRGGPVVPGGAGFAPPAGRWDTGVAVAISRRPAPRSSTGRWPRRPGSRESSPGSGRRACDRARSRRAGGRRRPR